MVDLLPCPFCGSKNIDPEGWASTERSGPACDDCAGTADTVEFWNSRPTPAWPAAWMCTDERYEYVKGIVTTREETIRAWREGGIAFVGLYPPLTPPFPIEIAGSEKP